MCCCDAMMMSSRNGTSAKILDAFFFILSFSCLMSFYFLLFFSSLRKFFSFPNYNCFTFFIMTLLVRFFIVKVFLKLKWEILSSFHKFLVAEMKSFSRCFLCTYFSSSRIVRYIYMSLRSLSTPMLLTC